jgi:hypothetical protein
MELQVGVLDQTARAAGEGELPEVDQGGRVRAGGGAF